MIVKQRGFIPNNIKLRELSSLCISKYKQSQAFALGELCNNPKHVFSTTAKEILLLKYDIWFRWLIEVEDVLRRRHRSTDDIPGIIMRISDDLAREYTKTLREHNETFDPKFVEVWLESHEFMYIYLRTKILHLTVENLEDFMIKVTDLLMLVMDNTLFELYEIDNLFDNKEAFISFDDICLDYKNVMGSTRCLMGDRLNVYEKSFSLNKDVLVKDYSVHAALSDTGMLDTIKGSMAHDGYTIKAVS